MNKRFKKVISSVLAAVMTLGVVGVANVSSVFAATTALTSTKPDDTYTYTTITEGTNKCTYTYNFVGYSDSLGKSSNNQNFTIVSGEINNDGNVAFYGLDSNSTSNKYLQRVKNEDDGKGIKFSNDNGYINFTISSNHVASLTINGTTANGSTNYFTLSKGSTTIAASTTSNTSYNYTNLESGDYAIKRVANNGNGRITTLVIEVSQKSTDPVVELNKETTSLVVGSEETLTATPSNLGDTPSIAWTTSDDSVATVDESGKVTAVKAGSADITATATSADGSKSASAKCVVTVTNPVSVSSVTVSGTTSVNIGYVTKLTASVSPENASYDGITWASSNTDVATVDENGNVKGITAGTATITATAGGVDGTATVTVKAQETTVISENGSYDLKNAVKNLGTYTDTEYIVDGSVILDSFTIHNTYTDKTAVSSNAVIRTNPYLQIGAQGYSWVEFETSKAFSITVKFASTGGSNVSDIVLLDTNNNVVAHASTTGTGDATLTANNIQSGKYKIASPTSDQSATGKDSTKDESNSLKRGARLSSVTFADATPVTQVASTLGDGTTVAVVDCGDNSFLAVATIAKADIDKYSEIAVDGVTGSESSNVYASVTVNDTVYTAEQLTNTADAYVYAIKIAGGNDITADVNKLVKALTTSLTAAE